MKPKHLFTAISLSLLLSACASNDKKHPEIEEYLSTKITDENIKLFSYSADISMNNERGSKNGRGGKGGRSGMRNGGMGASPSGMNRGDRPDPQQRKQKMEQHFDQRLADKLEQLEYCREGYEVVDKTIERGYVRYRGRCHDMATTREIEKYKSELQSS